MGRWRRVVVVTVVLSASLLLAEAAKANPPSLNTVGVQGLHPTAKFSAPSAMGAFITIASKPDQGSDGSFFFENVVEQVALTDSELQTGQWLDSDPLSPGTYWLTLQAFPNATTCISAATQSDPEGIDPSCANGYSNVLELVVPAPSTRYTVKITQEPYLPAVALQLTATPLGDRLPYRVCWTTVVAKTLCLSGSLAGYDWSMSAESMLTVRTSNLAAETTFTWYVGSRVVAAKNAHVLPRRF
jgi:hypothetical protein